MSTPINTESMPQALCRSVWNLWNQGRYSDARKVVEDALAEARAQGWREACDRAIALMPNPVKSALAAAELLIWRDSILAARKGRRGPICG